MARSIRLYCLHFNLIALDSKFKLRVLISILFNFKPNPYYNMKRKYCARMCNTWDKQKSEYFVRRIFLSCLGILIHLTHGLAKCFRFYAVGLKCCSELSVSYILRLRVESLCRLFHFHRRRMSKCWPSLEANIRDLGLNCANLNHVN
jgi:hypothetical protein